MFGVLGDDLLLGMLYKLATTVAASMVLFTVMNATIFNDFSGLTTRAMKHEGKEFFLILALILTSLGLPINNLGNLGTFLKGSGVRKDECLSGNIACIRYGEIYTKHNDIIREFYSWISPEVASKAVKIRKGDLLFAGSGETKEEIGKCVSFIDDLEAYAGGDIVILRPNTDYDSCFLGYYLNTVPINKQKASKGQGDAVVHISASALSQIDIKIPPKAEQEAIAEVLTDMDNEIEALEKKLNKTRQLKQGMMQELLTGRIRLT